MSLVIASALVAACSGGSASPNAGQSTQASTTTVSAAPAYTPVFAMAACDPSVTQDARVQCGRLTVPEDRTKPNGRSVTLPVATIHPKQGMPAPDPILFVMGGPGFSGLANVADFLTRDFGGRDVIVFDQRGSGLAQPNLRCPEGDDAFYDIHATGDLTVRSSLFSAAVKASHDRLVGDGIDLAAYNSVTDAADIADLRVAMGIATWDVWGMSYGTRVALETARSHPQGIRSLIVESVEPLTSPNFSPEFVTKAMRQLYDGCATSPICSAKYPRLEADVNEVVATLNTTPHHGTIHDPAATERPIVVTGDDALAVLWFSMFDPRLIPGEPSTIEQLRGGDYSYLDGFTAAVGPSDTYSMGADLSFECADDGTPTDSAATLATHPDYSVVVGQDIRQGCTIWDVPQLPASFHQPVASDVPALVLADEYDPNTPAFLGKQAADNLADATFVLFPGLGHIPTFVGGDLTACPRSIMAAYVADPAAPLSTACIASLGPPAWR
jgi:pimeloyl-ACP methyl ester carboxylesterase